MGRRALRRVDPSLDLSRHFLLLEQLAAPASGAELFGRHSPLEIEVGSGKGLFLAAAAAAAPEHDFLGIEILGKYARFVAARLARRELANARVIHGDAQHFFHTWLPADSVAAVHVYFPDPWWKARHKKRRVMNEAFLADVERVLATSGTLHFWTDVEEYFETTLALVAAHTRLVGPRAVVERTAEDDLDYRTHFERRTRKAGESVFRAEFDKR